RVGIDKRSARRAPGPGWLTTLYRAGLDCSCAGRTGRGSPPGERVAASDAAKSPGLPLRLGGRLAAGGSPKLQNQASAGWLGRRRGTGEGLVAVLASQERIMAALDARTVLAFNHEKLFGERAAPQFLQAGELLEKLLTLLPEVWVIG